MAGRAGRRRIRHRFRHRIRRRFRRSPSLCASAWLPRPPSSVVGASSSPEATKVPRRLPPGAFSAFSAADEEDESKAELELGSLWPLLPLKTTTTTTAPHAAAFGAERGGGGVGGVGGEGPPLEDLAVPEGSAVWSRAVSGGTVVVAARLVALDREEESLRLPAGVDLAGEVAGELGVNPEDPALRLALITVSAHYPEPAAPATAAAAARPGSFRSVVQEEEEEEEEESLRLPPPKRLRPEVWRPQPDGSFTLTLSGLSLTLVPMRAATASGEEDEEDSLRNGSEREPWLASLPSRLRGSAFAGSADADMAALPLPGLARRLERDVAAAVSHLNEGSCPRWVPGPGLWLTEGRQGRTFVTYAVLAQAGSIRLLVEGKRLKHPCLR